MRNSISIVLLTLLSACIDPRVQSNRDFLENYTSGLAAFPSDLTDHFPGEIKTKKQLYIHYPSVNQEVGMSNMFFSHIVDTIYFNNVRGKLELNNIKPYKPNDSIFIVVGDTIDYSEKQNGIPIPNFYSYQRDFGLNDKYLPEHHMLYVLEYNPGKFLEEKYLTQGNNLPKKWRNGYSRGIAINEVEKELIYWLCVW